MPLRSETGTADVKHRPSSTCARTGTDNPCNSDHQVPGVARSVSHQSTNLLRLPCNTQHYAFSGASVEHAVLRTSHTDPFHLFIMQVRLLPSVTVRESKAQHFPAGLRSHREL